MRIAVFSDIHGNQYALSSFISQIDEYQVDQLVFCGDIFGYYYGQEACINFLKQQRDLVWIMGNHETLFLDLVDGRISEEPLINKYGNSYKNIVDKISESNVSFLRSLSTHAEYRWEGKRIIAVHGTLEDQQNGRLYPADAIALSQLYEDYDYVILGHTHFRMNRECGRTKIINPGSLGQPRDGKAACFAILDIPKGHVEYVEICYNIDALAQEISEIDYGNEKIMELLNRGRIR